MQSLVRKYGKHPVSTYSGTWYPSTSLQIFEIKTLILDKYGFKGTFFTVCNFIGTDGHMNWTQINALQKESHDIGSHSMNHKHLSKLSDVKLQYEIGQSIPINKRSLTTMAIFQIKKLTKC